MKRQDSNNQQLDDQGKLREATVAGIFLDDIDIESEESWREVESVIARWSLIAADRIWLEPDMNYRKAFLLGVIKAASAIKNKDLLQKTTKANRSTIELLNLLD